MLKSKNIFLAILLLVPLSLFFPAGVTSMAVALLFIYCLSTHKKFSFSTFKSYPFLLYPVLLFSIYVCGLFFSTNFDFGISVITRKIPLLLIPLSFIIVNQNLSKKEFHLILLTLLISCIFLSFFCYTRAIINITYNQSIIYPDNVYRMYYFAYKPLTQPFEPLYLSIYANLAFVIALRTPFIQSTRLRYSIAIYIIVFILMIAAKTGIISLAIILIVLLIKSKNNRKLSYAMALLLIPVFVFSAFKFPFLKERFITSFAFDYGEENGGVWNSNTLRLAIWASTIDAIKESPIFGFGPGDGQLALENAYLDKGFVFGLYYKHHPGIPQYNAHNEFLSTALDLGLIGLVPLVLLFIYGFRRSIDTNDFISLGFMIIILIAFNVESVLMRQKGIIFFSFFYSLIFWNMNKNED